MASVNKVIILGNLGRDPETRFSGNNLQITSMSVATTSYRRSAETQERVEETEWHRVVLFGRQAEIAQQYLKKGSRVYLEGRLRTRKWEKDGQTHYSTEILADTLQLIDRKSDVVGGYDLAPDFFLIGMLKSSSARVIINSRASVSSLEKDRAFSSSLMRFFNWAFSSL